VRDAAGTAISGRVFIDAEFPHWVTVPTGGASINLPEGSFRAMAISDASGFMVIWHNFYLASDATQDFYLPPSTQRMSEDFSAGLTDWTASGTG